MLSFAYDEYLPQSYHISFIFTEKQTFSVEAFLRRLVGDIFQADPIAKSTLIESGFFRFGLMGCFNF
ncbi:MAG: hypothetical protein BGO34_01330 [Bacteroidia bacterium 44-10]|nr:MAG: hypothetical protein BGO34_01330 [Bacteroidia bacterium 44-10]